MQRQGFPHTLQNDYEHCERYSGVLMEARSRQAESGEALRVRVAGKTATLNQIALTAAGGLQELLRIVAEWIGEDPEAVVIKPNLDFVDDATDANEIASLQTAKLGGAVIAARTIHGRMFKRGITALTYEEEVKQIEAEKSELEGVIDVAKSMNTDGPEPDEEGDGNSGAGAGGEGGAASGAGEGARKRGSRSRRPARGARRAGASETADENAEEATD